MYSTVQYMNITIITGKFWRITDDNGEETNIYGWDYSEDHIWPDTDSLYILGM